MSMFMDKDLSKLEDFTPYRNGENKKVCYLVYNKEKCNSEFNIELIEFYINKLKEKYIGEDLVFNITYKLDANYMLDTNDCKKLEEIDNYLRDNLETELLISEKSSDFHAYGFRKTLSANRKLDEVANSIKNATTQINGKTEALSNFEKLMLAYEYVTNYVYNEGGDVGHSTTSHWVPVIEGDKIVCSGYASLLKALCDRIFNKDEVCVLENSLDVYDKTTKKFIAGHGNNVVFLKDEKYNIDGLFYLDPCWDSINKTTRQEKQHSYFCLPVKDILKYKKYTFSFSTFIRLYLKQFPEYKNIHNHDKKSITSEIEDMFMYFPYQDKLFADFYNWRFNNLTLYNKYISKEERDSVFKNTEKREKEIEIETKELLKEKDIEIVQLPQFAIEQFNLEPQIDILTNPNASKEEKDAATIFIADILVKNEETVKKLVARGIEYNFKPMPLSKYIARAISESEHSANFKKLRENKEKFAKSQRVKNYLRLTSTLNKLANATIPEEAIINAYKIVLENEGADLSKLDVLAKERLSKAKERFETEFESENSNHYLKRINSNNKK